MPLEKWAALTEFGSMGSCQQPWALVDALLEMPLWLSCLLGAGTCVGFQRPPGEHAPAQQAMAFLSPQPLAPGSLSP